MFTSRVWRNTCCATQPAITSSPPDEPAGSTLRGYARIRDAELIDAPERVADALGLDGSSPVIRRRRTVYDNADQPVSSSVSWFDATLANSCPNLLVADRIKHGTTGYIEEQTGRVAACGCDQLAAGAATDEDATELNVPVGTPVLLGRNRWVDAEGTVVEYGESVSPPGRWALYEYAMNEEARK